MDIITGYGFYFLLLIVMMIKPILIVLTGMGVLSTVGYFIGGKKGALTGLGIALAGVLAGSLAFYGYIQYRNYLTRKRAEQITKD